MAYAQRYPFGYGGGTLMSRKDSKKKKKREMGEKARGRVESEKSPYPVVLNTDEGAIPRDTSAVVVPMIQTAQIEGGIEGEVPVGEIDGDVPATEVRRDDIDENAI